MMANLINLGIALVATGIFFAWMWKFKKEKLRTWMVVVVFFVSYPWQFENVMISLWGGVNTQGSVNSFVSVYSAAEDYAFAALSIGPQIANESAVQIYGTGIQFARNNTSVRFGLALWQEAGNEALLGFGIPIRQKGGNYAGTSWERAKENSRVR